MNSESGDYLLSKSFWEQQEKFKRQMQAVEMLEAEFLRFLWTEQPASPAQLGERFDRFAEALNKTGGLDASAVLALFDKLEQRALTEINKPLALAQTIDPDCIAHQCPDLPKTLITNTQAVHTHAYTTSHSKQAKGAAQHKRPAGRHPRRQSVENELNKWIHTGQFDTKKPIYSKFIKHTQELFPELNRDDTIRAWIKEYLSAMNT